MMRSISAVVRVGLVAVVLAGCTAVTMEYPKPYGSMTTLIPGWERYFRLQWTAEPEHRGPRRLDGYLHNRYGEYAARVRLLVQARDAADAGVDPRPVRVPAGVG